MEEYSSLPTSEETSSAESLNESYFVPDRTVLEKLRFITTMKFIRTPWFEEDTPEAYKVNRQTFGDLCIHLFLKNNREWRFLFDKFDEMDVEMIRFGKVVSPDFIVRDDKTNEIKKIIEFKTHLFSVKPSYAQKVDEKMKLRYGPETEVIHLVCNSKFLEEYRVKDSLDISLFYKMRRYLMKNISKIPKSKMSRYKKAMRNHEDIMKDIPFLKNQLPIDPDLNNGTQYLNLDEIQMEFLRNFRIMENFSNKNYLPVSDFTKSLKYPSRGACNIFSDHPWDRDLNRIMTNKIRGEEGLPKNNHGHRATKLMKFPISKRCLKMENKEVKNALKNLVPLLFKETENVKTFLDSYKLINRKEKKEIIKLNKEMAYLKTEAKNKVPKNIEAKYQTQGKTVNQVIQIIESKKEEILDQIKKDLNIPYLSKRGNVRLKKTDNFSEYSGVGKSNLKSKKPKTKTEFDALCLESEENYFEWHDLWDEFEKNNHKFSADFENAYPSNPTLNSFCNNLNDESLYELNKILSTEEFDMLYRTNKCYRQLVIEFNRTECKKIRRNELVCFRVENENFITFATPPPIGRNSEITSGAIWCLYKTYKNNPLPQWYSDAYKFQTKDYDFYLTKTFRLNQKIVDQHDQHLGSFLGVCLMCRSFGFDILKNGFFGSLFMEYIRDLEASLELIYYFYKNIATIGSFGKNELVDKINDVGFKDIRVCHIVHQIRSKFTNMNESYVRDAKLNGNWSLFKYKDPIFGFDHKDVLTLQCVTFLKQMYIKDDGFDPTHMQWKFFTKEVEYQQWDIDSPFGSKNLDPNKSMSIKAFLETVFNDDKWTKISYHPDTCYSTFRELFKKSKQKDPNLKHKNVKMEPVSKTSKKSKVAVNDSINNIRKPKETKYKGYWTTDLKEALMIETFNFERFLEEVDKIAINNSTMKNPFHTSNFKSQIEDEEPNLIDLALYEILFSPIGFALWMNNKIQVGKGKRNFFGQPIYARNLNRISDESIEAVLKQVQGDFLLTKGNLKFIDLEASMKRLNHDKGDRCNLAEDETKYGDTFAIYVLTYIILAGLHEGIYGKDFARFLMFIDKMLMNRAILVPPVIRDKINKLKETTTEYESSNDSKITMFLQKYSFIFDNPAFDGWEKENSYVNVMKNMAIKRTGGFTLGVFNRRGSFTTAAHRYFFIRILEKWGIGNVAEFYSHSDDSETLTSLPIIDDSIFEGFCVSEFLEKVKDLDTIRFIRNNDREFIVTYDNGIREKVSSDLVMKFIIVSSLSTPRFFGQRPSLAKWLVVRLTEILQVQSFKSSVLIPIIRYACALGKDSPGLSIGDDLRAQIGRVYDISVNGGDTQMVNNFIILTNYVVYHKFGLDKYKANVNKQLNCGGLYYCYPGFLLTQGFTSNLCRQLSNASYFKNLKNDFGFLLNDSMIWKNSDDYKKEEPENIEEEFTLQDEGEENFRGAPIIHKDFLISYNRHTKTDGAFLHYAKIFNPLFDSKIDEMKIDDKTKEELKNLKWNEKVKRLESYWTIEKFGRTGDSIQNKVFDLAVYLSKSYSNSKFRIAPNTQMIGRLGYIKRNYPNPFSKYITNKYKIESDILTIEEIWHWTYFISEKEGLSKDQKKIFDFIKQIYLKAILEINSIVIKESTDIGRERSLMMEARYHKIVDKNGITLYKRLPSEMLSIILEKWKFGTNIKETSVMYKNIILRSDENFIETIINLENLLKESGFDEFTLEKNMRLLERTLKPKGITAVIKCFNPESVLEDSFNLMFKTYKEGTYFIEFNRNLELPKTLLKSTPVKSESFVRGLVIGLVFKIEITRWSLYRRLDKVKIPDPAEFLESENSLYNRNQLNKFLLTCMIYSKSKFYKNFPLLTFYKSNKKKQQKKLEEKDIRLKNVTLTDRLIVGLSVYSYRVFLAVNKEGGISIFLNKSNLKKLEILDIKILDFLINFLVYFMLKREVRIKGIKNLIEKVDHKGDFNYYDGLFLFIKSNFAIYEINNKEVFFIKEFCNHSELKEYGYKIPDYKKIVIGGIEEKVEVFTISPWYISPLRSGLIWTNDINARVLEDKQELENTDYDISFYLTHDDGIGSKISASLRSYRSNGKLYTKIPFDLLNEIYNLFYEILSFKLGLEIPPVLFNVKTNLEKAFIFRRMELLIGVPITYVIGIIMMDSEFFDPKVVKVQKSNRRRRGRKTYNQRQEEENLDKEKIESNYTKGFEKFEEQFRLQVKSFNSTLTDILEEINDENHAWKEVLPVIREYPLDLKNRDLDIIVNYAEIDFSYLKTIDSKKTPDENEIILRNFVQRFTLTGNFSTPFIQILIQVRYKDEFFSKFLKDDITELVPLIFKGNMDYVLWEIINAEGIFDELLMFGKV